MQLENGNQILAEEKHLPLYEVRLKLIFAMTTTTCTQRSTAPLHGMSAHLQHRRSTPFPAGHSDNPHILAYTHVRLATLAERRTRPWHRGPYATFLKDTLHGTKTLLASELVGPQANTRPSLQELASRPDVQYIAGGATQNSIRVAQWMLQEAGQTAYFGCVGADKFAETMREVCTKDGIAVHYMVEGDATGTCAVCVVDNDRSLVANLAAANNYKVQFAPLLQGPCIPLLRHSRAAGCPCWFVTRPAGNQPGCMRPLGAMPHIMCASACASEWAGNDVALNCARMQLRCPAGLLSSDRQYLARHVQRRAT